MNAELNEQWLKDMQKAYLATADQKISELSQAISRYVQNPANKDNQRKLHRLLHNLIGSGGSYGFPEVSEIAQGMSDFLKQSRASETFVDGSILLPRLEAELDRLRLVFYNK